MKFEEVELSVAMPRKIGPKIIVCDVPNEMTSNELMREMYEKNVKGCMAENTSKERVRIMSRGGKRDAACSNVIMEIPSCVKNVLCREGRVFVFVGKHLK